VCHSFWVRKVLRELVPSENVHTYSCGSVKI
jgi:hypothetical protein